MLTMYADDPIILRLSSPIGRSSPILKTSKGLTFVQGYTGVKSGMNHIQQYDSFYTMLHSQGHFLVWFLIVKRLQKREVKMLRFYDARCTVVKGHGELS